MCDFDWCSDSDYDVCWEICDYDFDYLVFVDVILLYWDSRVIVYVMILFGFDDGCYVVFLVEICKKKGEVFFEIGGFFK